MHIAVDFVLVLALIVLMRSASLLRPGDAPPPDDPDVLPDADDACYW